MVVEDIYVNIKLFGNTHIYSKICKRESLGYHRFLYIYSKRRDQAKKEIKDIVHNSSP